jgi:hypothetical protein
MVYQPARGHTLLIPSGPQGDADRKHLFVIVTNECKDKQHLIVPISSVKPGIYHDPTCVLDPGAHPFITVQSYALYRRSETILSSLLTKCVDGWLYLKKEDATADLVDRILAGVLESEFSPERIRTYAQKNWPT